MMRFSFRGRKFKITYMDLGERDGSCLDESEEIEIDKQLKKRPRLDAEIHEALHACLPMLEEKIINPSARDIARFLWRVGYRLK